MYTELLPNDITRVYCGLSVMFHFKCSTNSNEEFDEKEEFLLTVNDSTNTQHCVKHNTANLWGPITPSYTMYTNIDDQPILKYNS